MIVTARLDALASTDIGGRNRLCEELAAHKGVLESLGDKATTVRKRLAVYFDDAGVCAPEATQ